MNVHKMRRRNSERMPSTKAENTPDKVSRVFDNDENINKEYMLWFENFRNNMQAKHGSNMKGIHIWESDIYGPTKRNIMIVLYVKLYKDV